MPQEIDFLKAKKQASLKQLKQKRTLKTGSLVFLIFYCLVAGGIFYFQLYLNQTNQKVEREINLKKQKIAQLRQTESLQILLKQRLSSLVEIFSQKAPDCNQIILFFEQISPEGLILTEFNFLAEGGITVAGEAANAVVLSNFLEELKKASKTKEYFSELALSSASRKKEGDYKFSLSLETK